MSSLGFDKFRFCLCKGNEMKGIYFLLMLQNFQNKIK